ncbi:hypothetical protein ES703_119508 [subsurface metagenome]
MNSSKRRYENKHKVTRIFLADYQLLKELSVRAGTSMAEALHKLIVKQAEPKLGREPVAVATKPAFQVSTVPAFEVRAQPAFEVAGPIALRARSQPVLATNGNKAGVFVIKPKGGIIQ